MVIESLICAGRIDDKSRPLHFFSHLFLHFSLPHIIFSLPNDNFLSTTPPNFLSERVLYSAVTYTLSGCINVHCNRPIPAHPPTPHPARDPTPTRPLRLAIQPPPGPTRPATPSPTRPRPARNPSNPAGPTSPAIPPPGPTQPAQINRRRGRHRVAA